MHFFHQQLSLNRCGPAYKLVQKQEKICNSSVSNAKHIDESSIVRGQKSSQKKPKRCSFRQITKQIETAFLLQQCPFFLLCTESEFHNPFNLLNPNRDNKSTDGIIRKISCNVSLFTVSKPVKRMNTSMQNLNISNTYHKIASINMCF